MLADLKELWRFRELLWAMVERDLKIRYKNSALGFLWSLLNPLATVFVMWVVFRLFMRNGTPSFTMYVLAAYLPYINFQMALMDSAQSVLSSLPVIRKVYFPREILPLASVVSNFINFLMALVVFFLFQFGVWAATGFAQCPFTWRIAFLPVLMLVQFVLTAGMAFLISAYNVFYEDVKYVVGVALYLMFFLTPVMYFSETVYYSMAKHGQLGKLVYFVYHLNPVAMFATAYRKCLVHPGLIDVGGTQGLVQPRPFEWPMFALACLTSVIILTIGYRVFNRLKWRFVERP